MASVKVSDEGVLQFRHPMLEDSMGYPKGIKRGVAKIPEKEWVDIRKALERLVELKPLLP